MEELLEDLRRVLDEERLRAAVARRERKILAKYLAIWRRAKRVDRWNRALEEGVYWVHIARWTDWWRLAWRRLDELKEEWGSQGVEAFRREEERRRVWQ